MTAVSLNARHTLTELTAVCKMAGEWGRLTCQPCLYLYFSEPDMKGQNGGIEMTGQNGGNEMTGQNPEK
jgi:hypothetical protein